MKFIDRLNRALFPITEMASFTLPEPILLPVDGQMSEVTSLDMRWEDYKDEHRYWGQWKPFVAELPDKRRYIIWNGNDATIVPAEGIPIDPDDPDYLAPGYDYAPDNWWDMAQGIHGETVVSHPARKRSTEY